MYKKITENEMQKKEEWAIKTVKVTRETHDRLTELKRGNMTYNDVITSLLKNVDE